MKVGDLVRVHTSRWGESQEGSVGYVTQICPRGWHYVEFIFTRQGLRDNSYYIEDLTLINKSPLVLSLFCEKETT